MSKSGGLNVVGSNVVGSNVVGSNVVGSILSLNPDPSS